MNPLKTPLLLLVFCLKILCCCGLALAREEVRDEAALAEFEERVKQLSSIEEASEVVSEVMASKDYARMEICLRYPRSASLVIRKYAEEPASEYKDRLTMDLIARPWIPQTGDESGRERGAGSPTFFKPYADYMRERLGEDIDSMGSPDDLLKPDATAEQRSQVARRFKNALVKTGIAAGKPTRPRKNWVPGQDEKGTAAAEAGSGGGDMTMWIVGAAVLAVAAGGFVVFKKKAA